MSMLVIIIAVLLIAVIGREVYAATHIQSCIYIDAQCTTGTDNVLLTFDDGPHPVNTPLVLDVLKAHNVKAVFFCIASQAEKYPELISRIIAEGHTIGQHTYYHNPFHSFYPRRTYLDELQKAHQVFLRLGVNVSLFRPPLGITNAMIRWAVCQMNYKVVAWSVRSFDTRSESRQKVLSRVTSQLRPGSIVLLHDRMDQADSLTRDIILYCHSHNLSLQSF